MSRQAFDRRRVYIFPTRPGQMMFALVLLILLGAANYDNAMAYVLCFLLGSMMFSAMLRTWRNLAGLEFEASEPTPVHVGDAARFVLHVTAPTERRRYRLLVRHLQRRGRFWWWRPASDADTTLESVGATRESVVLAVPALRRGWLTLERLEVSSAHPLGLFRTWGYWRPGVRCLIYPQATGSMPLPVSMLSSGEQGSAAGPGVDDFAGLRAYAVGDSPRRVHWKASARSETLLVKTLEGASAAERWLRWQDTAALGDPEARISQLAQWVLQAERAGFRYGLELPGLQLPPGSGPAHRAQALERLALL